MKNLDKYINIFLHRDAIQDQGLFFRFQYARKNLFDEKFFSICFMIKRIIDITIISSFTIIAIFLFYLFYSDVLITYIPSEINHLIIYLTLGIAIIFYMFHFFGHVQELKTIEEHIELKVAKEITLLALNHEYLQLQHLFEMLLASHQEELHLKAILDNVWNEEAHDVILKLIKRISTSKN